MVVFENLKNSFPDKSQLELDTISKDFYKHLSDILIESLKGFSMSKQSLIKRYKVLNPELADNYFKQNRSIIATASHYANWEWGVLCLSLQFKHQSMGLYKPLSNKYIDKFIRKSRSAWGMNLVSLFDTSRSFEENKAIPSIYFMVADQSPANTKKAYWVNFLNQDTACLHGPENYAKKYNFPVIYSHVQRIKRGYYTVSLSMVEKNPAEKAAGEITNAYMKILEGFILEEPSNWLWTHKRWKRKRLFEPNQKN